jgi:hypothetical protein
VRCQAVAPGDMAGLQGRWAYARTSGRGLVSEHTSSVFLFLIALPKGDSVPDQKNMYWCFVYLFVYFKFYASAAGMGGFLFVK